MTTIWDSSNVIPATTHRIPVDVSVVGGASHVTVGDLLGQVVFNATDITGATNMAAELETFVSDNQGYIVKIPDNTTPLLNGFGQQGILGATDDIQINFGRANILYDNTSRCIDLDNTSNASAEVTVTSITETQIHTNTLTSEILLASTLSAEAHDWVAIYSSDANPSKSGGVLGEIHQLISDESTLKIQTVGLIGRASDFTTTIKCRKLNASRKVYITGGIFSSNGDADDVAITSREECIRITGFVDPIVENVEIDAPWAQFIWFQCCAGAIADGIKLKNTLNMADYNGYSYGVVFYGMNGNCTAKNMVVRNGRHPAATTDGNSSTTTTWYNKGYPTYYKFLDIAGYNCYGTVVDSHEEGYGGLIQNISDHNPVEDANGFTGSIIQSRAARETIRDVTSIGGSRGIKITAIDHGFIDEVKISNVELSGKHNGSSTAKSIDIAHQDSITNKRVVKIFKSEINDSDIGVVVGKDAICYMYNVYVGGAEAYADCNSGGYLVITNMISDHQNSSAIGSTGVIFCRSAIGKPCTVIVTGQITVMEGNASNRPTHFFDERDTNDDKIVYHSGITSINKDGVTPIISREAGATTFIDASSVKKIDEIQVTIKSGITGDRPTLTSTDIGFTYLDTTLDADGKPIWWNGTAWVDATGLVV